MQAYSAATDAMSYRLPSCCAAVSECDHGQRVSLRREDEQRCRTIRRDAGTKEECDTYRVKVFCGVAVIANPTVVAMAKAGAAVEHLWPFAARSLTGGWELLDLPRRNFGRCRSLHRASNGR